MYYLNKHYKKRVMPFIDEYDVPIQEAYLRGYYDEMRNMSYFDASGEEPEKVYHAFVLGMIVSLAHEYEVKSNKESGYGRYEAELQDRGVANIWKLAIVFKGKRVKIVEG